MSFTSYHKLIDKYFSEFHLNKRTNDFIFAKRVFNEDLKKYENRLKQINFTKKNNVLDYGCGFGQWSLALSNLNNKVHSCDISKNRCNFLKFIKKHKSISNIEIKRCNPLKIPYPKNKFDALFCYGVLFCGNWKKLINEFKRVLKPNGILYLNANDIGWYVYLWETEKNKSFDFIPRRTVAKAFNNTIKFNKDNNYTPKSGHIIIKKKDLVDYLNQSSFTNIETGKEGTINKNKKIKQQPFLKGSYKGMDCVYEIIAKKRI